MTNYLALSIGAIALLFIFGTLNPGYITSYRDNGVTVPNEEFTTSWNGIEMKVQTVKITDGYGGDNIDFCGDDQVTTISNAISTNGMLELKSGMSSSKRNCQGNFIRATGTFPAGSKISGNCDLSAGESKNKESEALCSIKGDSVGVSERAWAARPGVGGTAPAVEKSFDITLAKDTELTFEVVSGVGYSGSSTALLQASYTPSAQTTQTQTSSQTSLPASAQNAVAETKSLFTRFIEWIKGWFQ